MHFTCGQAQPIRHKGQTVESCYVNGPPSESHLFHIDSGLSCMTPSDQWDFSKCDTGRDFLNASPLGLVSWNPAARRGSPS